MIAENVQLIILCWCIVCYIISDDDTESGLQYHARLETEQQRRQSKLSLTGKHSCFDIRFLVLGYSFSSVLHILTNFCVVAAVCNISHIDENIS